MKITLSWLKDHLETDASLEAIVDKLTMIGLEVEAVEDPGAALRPFRIARVISAEQHPNADRLKVCRVDPGDGHPVQVVCGAPNARTGMIGVFAPPGTHIPGTGLDLAVGTIRGVESRGMLLSERELGLSDEHSGIVELPADAPVGALYAEWAGLDDPVIDIAITPNRPDCTGVAGIARDLAAAGLGRLKDISVVPVPGEGPCPVRVRLEFGDTPSLCPAFALRLVRGVRNGPSPAWMQRRLRAIGLRPINALVDITNYITYDRGRPLHVFDAAKVAGDIVVRRAREGEQLLALDGRTYRLDPDICVITDDNGVESLAGIMGGEHSGASEETTDVLIESALWEPLNIARTGRRLGISSDARYRFERGVDPLFTLPGLELATQLVLELCGGTPSEITLAGAIPQARRTIAFPLSEVKRLSGLELERGEITGILGRLGFEVAGSGETLDVTAPGWRPDIEGKADLVEEVVRIAGLNRVISTPSRPAVGVARPILTLAQERRRRARRVLAARGLIEAVTWSFVPKRQAELFGGGAPELALSNPISSDLSDMRPSLIPGLVTAAQRNADRGYGDVALFEVGQIFSGDRPEDQLTAITGVRRGTAGLSGAGRHWRGGGAPVDVFDVKADALAVLEALGLDPDKVQIATGASAWYHPGRSGRLQLGPQTVLGEFGELHPETLKRLDVQGPIAVFEVILEQLPVPKRQAGAARPAFEPSALQPLARDFAFVVDETVAAERIVRAARGADKALITRVDVFDVFTGAALGAGRKSVAIAVTLQPRAKTLTDEEIEAVSSRIVAAVEKATGATLRA